MPFVWAGCVLAQQFQFWWALYELNTMPELSVAVFILMLVLAGVLFLAGALVLPSGEAEYPRDLAAYFTTDGSWGAGAVALYNLLAFGGNVIIFGSPVAHAVNLLNLGLVAVAALVVVTRARGWQVALTVAYVVVMVWTFLMATPVRYSSAGGMF